MLALSPATRHDCDGAPEFLETACGFTINSEEDEFPEFSDHGDLLDIIDFGDLFGVVRDLLPDLEIDPEVLTGEFSEHMNASSTEKTDSQGNINKGISGKSEEVVSKREHEDTALPEKVTYEGNSDRKKKYSFSRSCKNNEGKRKVKVDWTVELHKRFVEAVEQLGLEKAVPSRILELMGVHSLTRHNVASHLQKYRSHRKHLLAREAEAATWTRKRHVCGVYNVKNGLLAPAPTLGFPSLLVWGHPTVDQSVIPHLWPKHLPPYLHPIYNGMTSYLPTVATPLPPHHTVYKSDNRFGGARPLVDLHPSKESVDAAIGDVLTRPWLPLPLGLKSPAVDGVMTELHRQGVSDVPPTMFCA